MNQRPTTPDPMALLPLSCGISDETARIKASRLMNKLVQFNDTENWFKGVRSLGFHENASSTKRWRAILRLPQVHKDLIGFWLDRNNQWMERPDAKRTRRVLLVKLYADEIVRNTSQGRISTGENGLFLGGTNFQRSAILHPERVQSRQINEDSTIIFMKITFHVLQRLFQRGYGLSDEGELSYERLLKCLFEVWLAGENLFLEAPEKSQVIVPYDGLRFVLSKRDCVNNEAPLDLVTVLPAQK